MKIAGREQFLKQSTETLGKILEVLDQAPEVMVKDLPAAQTALVIIDMVNGFVREGALISPDVEKLIPAITSLQETCKNLHIPAIAFADSHTAISPEFTSYPIHCMEGTSESEIVDEIKEAGDYLLFPKNSTNGFLEEKFQSWLKDNDPIENFIITGDCTDICVQQFAITLKTWFNMQNRKSRVIVPMSCVETYTLGIHDGALMNVFAFYNMMINGVELASELK